MFVSRIDAAAEVRAFAALARRIKFRDGGSAEQLMIDLDALAETAERRAREIADPKRHPAAKPVGYVFFTGPQTICGRTVIVERRKRERPPGRILPALN
jgi:hypothetical protein